MGLIEAGISAGTQLLSSGINAFSQNRQNKKDRRWQELMYNKQRADSLSDYHMQNQYNSPEAQMMRLRQAGLNPNLVYGNGATQEAAPIRSADAPLTTTKAPMFDLGSAAQAGLSAYYDTQIKDATIQNLKQQNEVAQSDKLLKDAQRLATIATAGKTTTDQKLTEFDLALRSDMRNFSLEAARLSNQKAQADITYTLAQNERAALTTHMGLKEAIARIGRIREQNADSRAQREQIRQTINNLRQDERTKQLENNLREKGLNPTDPAYQRILGQLIQGDTSTFAEKLTSPLVNWKYVDSTFENFKRKKGYK